MTSDEKDAWVLREQGKHYCECGCGELINVITYHIYKGVPRYKPSHVSKFLRGDQRGNKLSLKEWIAQNQGKHMCNCGCGKTILITKSVAKRRVKSGIPKIIRGHNLSGKKPHNWKGGKKTESGGYISILQPNHPFAMKSRYVKEHRLVYENYLREHDPGSKFLMEINGDVYLKPETVIHHKNHDRKDNRVENLQAFSSNGEHTSGHFSTNHPAKISDEQLTIEAQRIFKENPDIKLAKEFISMATYNYSTFLKKWKSWENIKNLFGGKNEAQTHA